MAYPRLSLCGDTKVNAAISMFTGRYSNVCVQIKL
jgi:hypothetical protein